MKEIRLLHAEEIDIRVGSIYDTGITLLLYKDARSDMTILDEVFGSMGWQRRHFMVGDAMCCEVSVKDTETGEWITKSDVGSPSYTEPLKGAASDSFKRACVSFSIGRELYSAPFIWIDTSKVEIKMENGKKRVKDRFRVQSISYNKERRIITALVIVNQRNEVVYQYMDYSAPKAIAVITPEQEAAFLRELKRTGVSLPSVLRKHKLNKISEMSPELWKQAMESMAMLPDIAA